MNITQTRDTRDVHTNTHQHKYKCTQIGAVVPTCAPFSSVNYQVTR